jgi:predicted nucleic acid-binding protein
MGPRSATDAEPLPVDALFDTSAAVALVQADHELHQAVASSARGWRRGLAGHAWFETYSVLTRLPSGQRRSPEDVHRVLSAAFPESRFLDAGATARLPDELVRLRIAGGAVYDALVGAAARSHGVTLVTCDRRAMGTYHALGVPVLLVHGS